MQKIVGRIYPEECVNSSALFGPTGRTVVLSSSALTVQVEPVARLLGIKNVLSNKFQTDEDGLLTGRSCAPSKSAGQGQSGAGVRIQRTVSTSRRVTSTPTVTETFALMYLVGDPRPSQPGGQAGGGCRQTSAGGRC